MLTKLARAPLGLSGSSSLLASSVRSLSISSLLFQQRSSGSAGDKTSSTTSANQQQQGQGQQQQQGQKQQQGGSGSSSKGQNDAERQAEGQEKGPADRGAEALVEGGGGKGGSSVSGGGGGGGKGSSMAKMVTVQDAIRDGSIKNVQWRTEWKGKKLAPHDQWPERDLINYPPHRTPAHHSPTRWYFVPESWFTFFYEKTGVTGPYFLFYGFLIWGFSTEYIVFWYDFSQYLVFTAAVIICVKKLGPIIGDQVMEWRLEEEASYNQVVNNSKALAGKTVHELEKAKERAKNVSIVTDVRREIINMQLEAAYRERLRSLYDQVKRRLDYQVALQNARKDFERSNMINWITSEVRKAITGRQEQDTLQACLNQLKSMATSAR